MRTVYFDKDGNEVTLYIDGEEAGSFKDADALGKCLIRNKLDIFDYFNYTGDVADCEASMRMIDRACEMVKRY